MSFEAYKQQFNFDTSNGVDRSTELYIDDDQPFNEMLIHKLGFITLDNDGGVIANHPAIKEQIDKKAFHYWYDEDRHLTLYQETYDGLSDEAKDKFHLEWNTEEERERATRHILENFEYFYSKDLDDAHLEALRDNEFVDVANSLMALSYEYSQKNPDDIAFSGLVKFEDFDWNGNLIREFDSEEAELAHMFWVDYLESVGVDGALADQYEVFREQLLAEDLDAAMDVIEESGVGTIFKFKLVEAFQTFERYFGSVSDDFINQHSARELMNNLPLLKHVPSPGRDKRPGEIKYRPIKGIPVTPSSYVISNAAFSKLTAGLAVWYTEYDYHETVPSHINHSEHTNPSTKHYWTLGDYTKY